MLSVLLLFSKPLFASDFIGEATLAIQAEIVPEKNIQMGDQVFVGNEFVIGAEGTLTILFVDESLLTLLPGSRAIIEEFSLGGKGKKGKCVIRILSGEYRWVPGKILAEGGMQYVTGVSAAGPDQTAVSGGNYLNMGQAGQKGKGAGGSAPDFVGSNTGNAAGGGVTAGVFYNKKCEDCPTPTPGFKTPSTGGGSDGGGGMSAGVPIINTGAFGGGNGGIVQPIDPPIPLGGAPGGTNWIPADGLMSNQGMMLGAPTSSPEIKVPNSGLGDDGGVNTGVPIINSAGLDPAAAAAKDIASMMNPSVLPGNLAVGITEPGKVAGGIAAPQVEMGGMVKPATDFGSLRLPSGDFGGLAVPKGDIGSIAMPSADVGSVALPQGTLGTYSAPIVETGTIAAPTFDMKSMEAPVGSTSLAVPTVDARTLAAPSVESTTIAAPTVLSPTLTSPTVKIGVETLQQPLSK